MRAGGLTFAALTGQLLGMGSLVLIGRTFSHADIGEYQVLVAYLGIMSTIHLLALPTLLPHLPEEEIPDLLRGLLILVACSSLLSGLGFFMFGYRAAVPLGLLLGATGLMQISEMMNIREARFHLIAIARVAGSLFFLPAALGFWYFGNRDILQLIWAQVGVSTCVAALYSFSSLRPHIANTAGAARWLTELHRRRKTPLLILPSNVLSALAYNLPVVLIERFFGAAAAAQYGMVLRFCFGPVTLLGDSISKVLHQRLAGAVRNADRAAHTSFLRVRSTLSVVGVLAAVLMGASFPFLFGLLLGPGWEPAGEYSMVLSPVFGAMIAIAPLSVALLVFEAGRFLLAVQATHFAIAVASFGAGIWLNSLMAAVVIYSIAAFLRYLLILRRVSTLARERLGPPAANVG